LAINLIYAVFNVYTMHAAPCLHASWQILAKSPVSVL